MRPYELFTTVEDAVGASVAWLCPFTSVSSLFHTLDALIKKLGLVDIKASAYKCVS